ncbi:metal ABC transporter solute-binding protein, Zn/Mn family [Alkaliphilus metalliredigens]|uniref:metal ABC transporter solute-binding protein, Zn/Mn family n=1 Tax=Alkaliphilus metalliredigens TaxID=208226 RepID=UPI0002F451A2|nr:zinc ABC transporter substrate-binding protein [Alkaliphilus metalliredigens]
MKKRIFTVISLLMMVMLILGGCAQESEVSDQNTEEIQEAQKIKVFASFYPLYDFAGKIGGDRIDLQTIVPAGTEPHSIRNTHKNISPS